MTIEQAIEHAEQVANSYNDTVPECECAKEHRQLAAWLRELQERRKAPEIIRCGECKNKSFCPSKIDCGDGLYWYVRFCSRGERDERRTDGMLENLPTVQPEPQEGHWIGKYPTTHICSECGWLIHDSKVKVFAYCPNCGAKMRGKTK